jgi:predicted  nucleic acid-binding Zn-ribbon protein
LKIVDNDNTFNYSNIVALKVEGKSVMVTKTFPNPTRSNFNIEIVADKKQLLSAEVFDIIGKRVGNYQVNVEAGLNKKQISLSALAAGTYIIQLKDEKGNIIEKVKIIKE